MSVKRIVLRVYAIHQLKKMDQTKQGALTHSLNDIICRPMLLVDYLGKGFQTPGSLFGTATKINMMAKNCHAGSYMSLCYGQLGIHHFKEKMDKKIRE